MKERPILFNAPMVRALLDGSKTQTRRAIKTDIVLGREALFAPRGRNRRAPTFLLPDAKDQAVAYCPYGTPGDQLWVRERFRALECGEIDYFADGKEVWERMQDHLPLPDAAKWKPSIHMPRWASRITLEITGVRVERLQDISGEDCWAEGISEIREKGDEHGDLNGSVTHDYRALWESINGPGSWDANPWVWVVEFKRVTE